MASFTLTLPATRVAVASLDPVFAGLGRAVVAAAVGYAEGARLARTLGGWQVICSSSSRF